MPMYLFIAEVCVSFKVSGCGNCIEEKVVCFRCIIVSSSCSVVPDCIMIWLGGEEDVVHVLE